MIKMRRAQLNFIDSLIAAEVLGLREDWMPHADQVLADEQLMAITYEALAKRRPKSRSRGRQGTHAGRHHGRGNECALPHRLKSVG
jgi:IS5 family transposase